MSITSIMVILSVVGVSLNAAILLGSVFKSRKSHNQILSLNKKN